MTLAIAACARFAGTSLNWLKQGRVAMKGNPPFFADLSLDLGIYQTNSLCARSMAFTRFAMHQLFSWMLSDMIATT